MSAIACEPFTGKGVHDTGKGVHDTGKGVHDTGTVRFRGESF